jgi:hypothetical protein
VVTERLAGIDVASPESISWLKLLSGAKTTNRKLICSDQLRSLVPTRVLLSVWCISDVVTPSMGGLVGSLENGESRCGPRIRFRVGRSRAEEGRGMCRKWISDHADGVTAGAAVGAVVISLVSLGFSIHGNDIAQKSLDNASPDITLVPSAGRFDSDGKKFMAVPGKTLLASIADIRNDRDWLRLTFENGGGREIRIDQVGIVAGNGNEMFFSSDQLAAFSEPCASNSAVGTCGSAPFTVKPSESDVVFYPLFATADWLQGGYENHDEELHVVYRSNDTLDKGQTLDALVKITP